MSRKIPDCTYCIYLSLVLDFSCIVYDGEGHLSLLWSLIIHIALWMMMMEFGQKGVISSPRKTEIQSHRKSAFIGFVQKCFISSCFSFIKVYELFQITITTNKAIQAKTKYKNHNCFRIEHPFINLHRQYSFSYEILFSLFLKY